ncbi:MAG: hypothetical protein E7292_09835 [Lachnospiraceae bacterium]|nr:hypothetical protein [Lachnospiraceae bacterium]
MLQKEINYEFRKRLLTIHEPDRRDISLKPEENELELKDGVAVYIPKDADEVIITAARDFVDYLLVSMNVSAILKKGHLQAGEVAIQVTLAEAEGIDLGEYQCYRGYRVVVDNGVKIYANDSRGVAQALYYMEDLMNMRLAPFLKKGTVSRKPLYSPQMVHSGFGLDQYPNEHLSKIAHEGRDAILVFTKAVNLSPIGFLDFNELIFRAARYGIDVYAYSYMKSSVHPCDEGAEDYYESTYGTLFKTCPKLKGVVLVGESVNFPSKDPRVAKEMVNDDGIPSIKQTSFYYACPDYVDLITMIKNVSRKYNPEADIVFWTYNFSQTPTEDRVKLIKSLPKDISLQVTFEKSERYEMNGIRQYAADYSLVLEGYSKVFAEEAQAAKEAGIRLYSMTNTAGLTWDMGTVSYEPMPYQWMKRYRRMKEAHDKWGLCGIMECHHYGFTPSIITKLSQWCFTESDGEELEMEEILQKVLIGEYGKKHAEAVNQALRAFSEVSPRLIPSGEDQYGAFRVGPSYPFCLSRKINLQAMPHAMFGTSIVVPTYCTEPYGRASLIAERIWKEIDSLKEAKVFMNQGIAILEQLEDKNDNLLRLENMAKFISCYIQTGIHAKEWHVLNSKFDCYTDHAELGKVLDDMEKLLLAEKANATEAITYVELDSRLGWEPSMEYLGDKEHIEWKLRLIEYVLEVELKNYKISWSH